jgi:hypothetical protein
VRQANQHRIPQAKLSQHLLVRKDLLDRLHQRNEYPGDPIQSLHILSVGRQPRIPLVQVTPRILINGGDLATFVHQTPQLNADDPFITEGQISVSSVRAEPLTVDPQMLAILLAKKFIKHF